MSALSGRQAFACAVPATWNTFPSLPRNTNTLLFFSTKPERHFLQEAFSDAAGWSDTSSKGSP